MVLVDLTLVTSTFEEILVKVLDSLSAMVFINGA